MGVIDTSSARAKGCGATQSGWCLVIAVVSVGDGTRRGRRYLLFVLMALLAELVNLFEVVLAVNPVKFSPLPPGQGSEDGMVEHSGALAKASFAFRNLVVHG